ncbi:CGH_1_collapsed_G0015410.mRNA.1.CDS.1 [Saccharomyces cerevisiae]|nr:CGH_1_collapsed_G0015410.mRNA.1.CDS.1 [Saccharomyces cerevisiae]
MLYLRSQSKVLFDKTLGVLLFNYLINHPKVKPHWDAYVNHEFEQEPAPYIVKYFGFELGAQTSISVDKDRYLVNGVHEPAKLQDVLDGFINKFVLCGSCKNPETEIIITKDNDLPETKACGKRTPMDLRHKLSSFILKTHLTPFLVPRRRRKRYRFGQCSWWCKSQNAPSDGTGSSTPQHQDEDEDELSLSTKAAASTLEDIEVKDDEWAVDMSEEAIRARAKELEVNSELTQLDEYGEWLLEQAVTPEYEKNFMGGIERFLGLEHMI